MKLGKATRVAVGLATLAGWLFPIFAGLVWFAMFGGLIVLAASDSPGRSSDLPPVFGLVFLFSWLLFICSIGLGVLLGLGMRLFYLIHIALNRSVADGFKVGAILGLFLLPFIAEPVYYFTCIWPEAPPDWAGRPPA